MLPNQVISVALTVDGGVAVRQLFPIQALVPTHVGAVNKGKGKAWQTTDVYIIRSQSRSLADGIVVGQLHARENNVLVVFALVDGDRNHLIHGVVDTFGATVGLWVSVC